jgi:hypothetical protein
MTLFYSVIPALCIALIPSEMEVGYFFKRQGWSDILIQKWLP